MFENEELNPSEPKITKLRELIDKIEASKAASGSSRKTKLAKNDVYSEESSAYLEQSDGVVVCSSKYSDEDGMDVLASEECTAAAKNKGNGRRGRRGSKKDAKSEERFTTVNQVYDYALTLLTYRDYSKAEMQDKLLKKGAAEELVRDVIVKLLEYNFLNEERYAFRVYEMWLEKRVYGRAHLQSELRKRSVEPDCIAKVMDTFTHDIEEQRAEVAAALFMQQNRKKLQELENMSQPEDTYEDDSGEEENSLRRSKNSLAKGSKWNKGLAGKKYERMAALKKIQAAAGRFMAARGFSARYMHILLSKLHCYNDI